MMNLAELQEQMDSLDSATHEALRERLWRSCCRLTRLDIDEKQSKQVRGDNIRSPRCQIIPFPGCRRPPG